MKVFSFEFGSIILGLFLIALIYFQFKKIEEHEETIFLQNDAIQKQQFLIDYYKYQLGYSNFRGN